jgi:hypothetical protein
MKRQILASQVDKTPVHKAKQMDSDCPKSKQTETAIKAADYRALCDELADAAKVQNDSLISMHMGSKQIARIEACKLDCQTLPAAKLREKYEGEYNSHRNMLGRRRTHGRTVAKVFMDFRSFLFIMGPKGHRSHTVDRTDNDNLHYAPGLVRWATKLNQTRNRSNTLSFIEPVTGRVVYASQIEHRQHVCVRTLSRRRAAGWTDGEIIKGVRGGAPVQPPSPASASICKEASFWISTMEDKDGVCVLTYAERQLLKTFGQLCPPDRSVPILKAILANWMDFILLVQDYKGKGWKSPHYPSKPDVDFAAKYIGIAAKFAEPKPSKKAPDLDAELYVGSWNKKDSEEGLLALLAKPAPKPEPVKQPRLTVAELMAKPERKVLQ